MIIFLDIKRQLEIDVLPAVKAVQSGREPDGLSLGALDEWILDRVSTLAFDMSDKACRLRSVLRIPDTSIRARRFFEEAIAVELFDFCRTRGIAAFGKCRFCQNPYIWKGRDTRFCTKACKQRNHLLKN
jgi:hypothetical protein